ncbi:translocation protein TolB [Planctomycetes bacterium Pan216]|uniref:Translocation protein TolB n=1 Tax=Kolteria novifilia TaxID=2527975 RepID=A0A518B1X2_9BACT|nr:translocation protein TolB [Planctomycetes bacterium Pan216]
MDITRAYHEWLGIDESIAQPNHYQLLGLENFEANPDTIHRAALTRIAKLRPYQAGQHSELSQELMNQISMARVCLLDAEAKGEYDLQLNLGSRKGAEKPKDSTAPDVDAARLAAITGSEAPPPRAWSKEPEPEPVDEDDELEEDEEWEDEDEATSGKGRRLVLAGGSIAVALVVGALAYSFLLPQQSASTENGLGANGRPPLELPPVAANEQVLYEAAFDDELGAQEFCRIGFPSTLLPIKPAESTLDLSVDGAARRGLFLPMPKGNFRLLLRVNEHSFTDLAQRVVVGAFRTPNELVGAESSRAEAGSALTLRVQDEQRLSRRGRGIPPGPCWIELRRTGKTWSVGVSDDGKSFTNVASSDTVIEPVALGILVSNASTKDLKYSIDHLRLEGGDVAYRKSLDDQWPRTLAAPTADESEEYFGTPTTIDGDLLSTRYTFERQPEIEAWGGKLNDVAGVDVYAGRTVQLGPITDPRRVLLSFRLGQPTTSVQLYFSDGGELSLDPKNGTIGSKRGRRLAFPFEADKLYELRLERKAADTYRVAVDNKEILITDPGFGGRLSLKVGGQGHLQVTGFEMDGPFAGLDYFLASLRKDAKAIESLKAHTTDPKKGSASPRGASPELIARLHGPPRPLDGPRGTPIHLDLVNSDRDERHPSLDPTRMHLVFQRSTPDESRLLRAEREEATNNFQDLLHFSKLSEAKSPQTPAISPDAKEMLFTDNKFGPYQLFVMRRSTDGMFQAPDVIHELRSHLSVTEPAFTADGLTLYYVIDRPEGKKVYQTQRSATDWPFEKTAPLPFPFDYHSPSVTADGLTMYLEGPLEDGRRGIFQSKRSALDAPWTVPVPLPNLADPNAEVGDVSPFVTADGKWLYFASDRPGGVGGFDLWTVHLPQEIIDGPPFDQTPSPAEAVDPRMLAEVVPIPNGRITEGMVLGPLPEEELPMGAGEKQCVRVADRLTRRLREIPTDKVGTLTWKRRVFEKMDEPGAYLVYVPLHFEVSQKIVLQAEDLPGQAFLRLDGRRVPLEAVRRTSNPRDPWERFRGLYESKLVLAKPGQRPLVGLLCVGADGGTINLQVVPDNDVKPLEGVSLDFGVRK